MNLPIDNTMHPSTSKATPSGEIANRLEKLLAEQFLAIMTEDQEPNEFTGGSGAAQFRSFLNEHYASTLADKKVFNIRLGSKYD